MDTHRICNQCRQPLPENAAEELCPACLAKVALASEPTVPGATINVNPLAEAAPTTRVPPDPAQLAAQFPQLEIIELLGMGGMAMVYKARQPRVDRLVALKILPVASRHGPSFAERFQREAKALAKLNHPGIVAFYDFGQTSEYYYFVMEYVDGMNLRHLLQTQTLGPRQALELVVQICTALQYAHDEGVVHRDIKPENILLNKKGHVKIADFGLAKLLGNAQDPALTMSQAAMGTMNYMAPEQRQNAQGVDHRADIYSLGVVFYEMLTGEVPMGRFEPPSKRVQVDVRLDEVVLRALEREPARRYQQVSEVKSNVETITTTTTPAAATPPAPKAPTPAPPPTAPRAERPAPPSKRNPALAAGSVVVVLIIALLVWRYEQAQADRRHGLYSKDMDDARSALAASASDPTNIIAAVRMVQDALRWLPSDSNAAQLKTEVELKRDSLFGKSFSEATNDLASGNYVASVAQLQIATTLKPDNADARLLRDKARANLAAINKILQSEAAYQVAMMHGQALLARGDYTGTLAQAVKALLLKAGDAAAQKLREDAQKKLRAINIVSQIEADYQAAMKNGLAALARGGSIGSGRSGAVTQTK